MRNNVTLAAAVLVTTGLLAIAGPAAAATDPAPASRVETATNTEISAGAFSEIYRGRHIMGWGRDDSACAYIDGIQLVLYPVGNDWYVSAVQAYEQAHGVREITKASVRTLGELDLFPPTEAVPHCPRFLGDTLPG
ncbi:tyrosinase family oxidase copper chaperone [Actinoplanes sp. NPDC051859]|uniref:tyrosinase family oxidase copper chaperone n=1 Tax=Actinoplanes sp. NPDC051859 TaxID=3363909 RepID=UPI00378B4700